VIESASTRRFELVLAAFARPSRLTVNIAGAKPTAPLVSGSAQGAGTADERI